MYTGAAALALLLAAGPAWSTTAGPDSFGYTAADDAETGVTYSWVDMSGGTDITSTLDDDDQSAAIPLGFDFTFYGETYTSVYVLTNGALVFEPLLSTEYSPFHGTQCPLPSEDEVDGMIAFYQRDFDPTNGACGTDCWIRHDSGGTAPNRWWGVTFNEVVIFRDTGSTEDPDPLTVQVILNEDNSIKVQVHNTGLDEGEDTMIGVEAKDGVAGLSFPGCMTTGYTYDEQAVEFYAPTSGTPVVPLQRVGWALPGNTVTHDFRAYNLESTDAVFDVTATGGSWTTTPSSSSVTVTTGSFVDFTVDVDIPTTAAGGEADVSTITLSPTSGGVSDMPVEVVTLVQDEADDWQRVSYMPLMVERPYVGVDGNDIVMVSGLEYDALALQYIITADIQILHTDTMTWSHSDAATGGTLTQLDWGTAYGAACGMNGHVYITGGQTGDSDDPITNALHIYDIATDTWTNGAAMPDDRFFHTMVCDPGRNEAYVLGGFNEYDTEGTAYAQDTFWKYDADSDTWDETVAQLSDTRVRNNAELIDADTILVAGGAYGGFWTKRTDIYHIDTDTWEQSGNLSAERFNTASGVLPPDRMCLSGGTSYADLPATIIEDTYECYSEGFWIPQVALMFEPRSYVVGATVNDQIYVIGGVELDTLAFPPPAGSTYIQKSLIERYPSSELPDTPPDTATDTVDDTAGDVPADVPVDVPTDTSGDGTTDVSVDIPDDDDGGDGDSGCGCSIVG
jgi:N-acetylneuraminic acid mutarotase